MADNMDLDTAMATLGPSFTSSTSSTRTTTFRPKPKGATAAATAKTTIKPKIEPKDAIPTPSVPTASSPVTNPEVEPEVNPKVEEHVEVVEEDEDEVEREIDVFLSPFPLDENETEVISLPFRYFPATFTGLFDVKQLDHNLHFSEYIVNLDLMSCQIKNPEIVHCQLYIFLNRTKDILELEVHMYLTD
jgi:hypothetical protein